MNTQLRAALSALPFLLALVACEASAEPVSGVCDYAPSKAPSRSVGLDSTQKNHAETIILTGAAMGMPRRGVEVAITAALQESSLDNGAVGDQGTAFGLFQMRPMYGWGSHAQVTNPDYAARKFYRVLSKVDGWAGMSHADAAQAVEKSADGSLYRDNVRHAQKIVRRIAWEQCQKVK